MEMNIWNILLNFQFELNMNTRTWLQCWYPFKLHKTVLKHTQLMSDSMCDTYSVHDHHNMISISVNSLTLIIRDIRSYNSILLLHVQVCIALFKIILNVDAYQQYQPDSETKIYWISVARVYIFKQYEISENNCNSLDIVGKFPDMVKVNRSQYPNGEKYALPIFNCWARSKPVRNNFTNVTISLTVQNCTQPPIETGLGSERNWWILS